MKIADSVVLNLFMISAEICVGWGSLGWYGVLWGVFGVLGDSMDPL